MNSVNTPAGAEGGRARTPRVTRTPLGAMWAGWPGPAVAGALVGVLAPILVRLGNPGNMGICVACFTRDITGALGLHRDAAFQYLRPEVPALLLGATLAAIAFREFRPRSGSAPLARFFLGVLGMIGALVFLGCPWRVWLRLGGGDWNALAGIAGLAAGVGAGVAFLRRGFSLGRSYPAPAATAWIMPVLALGLLALAGVSSGGSGGGPPFSSGQGIGSQHAPIPIAAVAALAMGFVAQRTRFCTIGALRNLFLMRDGGMLVGVLALVGTSAVVNLALGQFHPGFTGQPAAHTDGVWNFLGMTLAGLAFSLAGGCPARQLVLTGEGDADAGALVLGLMAGAALAHGFGLVSSAQGPTPAGTVAVMVGLAICLVLGAFTRDVPHRAGAAG